MKFLFWLFVLVVAVVLALFAVANRESVSLGLWPLPFVLQAPLYLAVLLALLIGLLLGATAEWAGGASTQRRARRWGRRVAALEVELSAAQAQVPRAESEPGSALPLRR